MPEESDVVGEYVLGTLRGAERDAFEQELAGNPGLQAEVAAWERRLAPLAERVKPIEPSRAVWSAIEARLDREPIALHAARLRRALALWRGAAGAAAALAAGFAALAVVPLLQPRAPDQAYVAVVNRGGELPALIVRVDPGAHAVQVRALAAETPPDHSLELWYVHAGQATSLGLVGAAPRENVLPAKLDAADKIAVTLEPKGGSPHGVATGPIVYSGQLVPE